MTAEISVLFHGRRLKLAEGAKLTALPSGSILVVPPPNTPGHQIAVEITPEGDTRGHNLAVEP